MLAQFSASLGRRARLMASLSSVAVLSACGGGGDGGTDLSSYLPDFDAPAPISISLLTSGYAINPNVLINLANLLATAKYQNTPAGIAWINNAFNENVPNGATQDPLRTSGAAFAHATGLTGAGEIIAFSDGHVSSTHEAITGRLTVRTNGPAVVDGENDEHGTSVVSVAMGNSASFVGTAPGATGIFGTFWDTVDLTDIAVRALQVGAVAWNNSWGYTTLRLNQQGWNSAFSGSDGQAYITAIRNYANSGVVVFAVSNNDTGNAGLMDGLPVLDHSLEAGWIAVANGVPTFVGSAVSSVYLLSSPCYESARWCIVADGSWTAAEGGSNVYDETTGSSFAAPQVSGALAILAQAFPTLTPHQLRIRLLASAEDDFFTGDGTVELADGFFKRYSVLYGMGYLDIEAALRPIGPTAMSLSAGGEVRTDSPVLMTGTGFGDAIEMSLAGTNVAVRDALDAGFAMPAEALATSARPESQSGTLLAKSLASNLSAERKAAPGAVSDPFSSFTGPVLRMIDPDGTGTATVLLPQGGSDTMGVAVTRAMGDGDTRLDLGLKLARDGGKMMSLGGQDAATMASVTLGLTENFGQTGFLSLSGEFGVTDLGGSTEITGATTANFNAVKLSVGQGDLFAKGDRFTIGLGLPVAISSGSAMTELPVLREGAAMHYEDVTLDLSPDDRQIDLEMSYMAPLGKNMEMKLSVIHSDNFGNRAGVTDTSGAIAFAFKF